eukprot:TRINITY_DN34461_c0_g1_i1.p1 TRINITY_DN34461_c0_g1~~TRINITY_DN34461_c0_g1_i1.p1  ORF type:complete len:304 (+),score=24.23 TRINITY_DN34461_c0_g1_i1:112-912(+)
MLISLRKGSLDNGDLYQIATVRLIFSMTFGNVLLTAFLQTAASVFFLGCVIYQHQLPAIEIWNSGDLFFHGYIVIMCVIIVGVIEHERLAAATATKTASESRLAERLVKKALHNYCDCCLVCSSNYEIMEGTDRLSALLIRTVPARTCNFLDYLCDEDVERVKDFMDCNVAPLADQEDQDMPASVLVIHLRDGVRNHVKCHMFCSALRDLDGDTLFIFGISESGEADRPPATLNPDFESNYQTATTIGVTSSDFQSDCSSSSRLAQ